MTIGAIDLVNSRFFKLITYSKHPTSIAIAGIQLKLSVVTTSDDVHATSALASADMTFTCSASHSTSRRPRPRMTTYFTHQRVSGASSSRNLSVLSINNYTDHMTEAALRMASRRRLRVVCRSHTRRAGCVECVRLFAWNRRSGGGAGAGREVWVQVRGPDLGDFARMDAEEPLHVPFVRYVVVEHVPELLDHGALIRLGMARGAGLGTGRGAKGGTEERCTSRACTARRPSSPVALNEVVFD